MLHQQLSDFSSLSAIDPDLEWFLLGRPTTRGRWHATWHATWSSHVAIIAAHASHDHLACLGYTLCASLDIQTTLRCQLWGFLQRIFCRRDNQQSSHILDYHSVLLNSNEYLGMLLDC